MNRYAVAEPASYTDGPGRSRLELAIEAVEWEPKLLADVEAHMAETGCSESAAIEWRAELLLRGEEP